MTGRKFRMKRRKRRENSIQPIVYIHYVAFDEKLLTTGEKVKQVWMLRHRSTMG